MKRKFVEVGKKYGVIEVLEVVQKKPKKYKVRCTKCGRVYVTNGQVIFRSEERGCKECKLKALKKVNAEEYKKYDGKVYGRIKVLGFFGWEEKKPHLALAKCICLKCGQETEITYHRLFQGGANQCKKCADREMLKTFEKYRGYLRAEGTDVSAITERKINKNNSTGHTGVCYNAKKGKYRAYINFQRKQYGLGEYHSLKDAIAARKAGEKEIYGNFLNWYQEEYPDRWEKYQRSKKKAEKFLKFCNK